MACSCIEGIPSHQGVAWGLSVGRAIKIERRRHQADERPGHGHVICRRTSDLQVFAEINLWGISLVCAI